MKLKERRISIGATQKMVADACNVSVSAVSQWESGATTPTIMSLCLLAKFLHCTVGELMTEVVTGERKA